MIDIADESPHYLSLQTSKMFSYWESNSLHERVKFGKPFKDIMGHMRITLQFRAQSFWSLESRAGMQLHVSGECQKVLISCPLLHQLFWFCFEATGKHLLVIPTLVLLELYPQMPALCHGTVNQVHIKIMRNNDLQCHFDTVLGDVNARWMWWKNLQPLVSTAHGKLWRIQLLQYVSSSQA